MAILCAIMIVVMFERSFDKLASIFDAIVTLIADMAASRINIFGFFNIMRAIEILCLLKHHRSALENAFSK